MELLPLKKNRKLDEHSLYNKGQKGERQDGLERQRHYLIKILNLRHDNPPARGNLKIENFSLRGEKFVIHIRNPLDTAQER